MCRKDMTSLNNSIVNFHPGLKWGFYILLICQGHIGIGLQCCHSKELNPTILIEQTGKCVRIYIFGQCSMYNENGGLSKIGDLFYKY